jgi:hypothetical protein
MPAWGLIPSRSRGLTLIKLVRTTAADFGEGFGEVVG